MNNSENFIKLRWNDFFVSISIVTFIWIVYGIEIYFGYNFNTYGIYPRKLKGLIGIICSPFIHSNTTHVFNNSIPFLVLSSILFTFYRDISYKILFYGTLATGIITWVIARSSYHIGLSGAIYLLFSFIFFSGIIKKNYRLIAMSFITIFLYGSMIWYILPTKESISWEGHLSGFLVGIIFSFLFRNKGLKNDTKEYKQTEFDLLFDEEGNFIEDDS